MKNRTLLYAMTAETPDGDIMRLLETARDQRAHVACLILGEMPRLPYYASGVPPYGGIDIPEDWAATVQRTRLDLSARCEAVEQLLAREQVSGDVQVLLCNPVDVQSGVANKAMVCDAAHIAANIARDDAMFHDIAHGVLFRSPAALMLNGDALAPAAHVFVAWDNSLPAARAVHAALPLLQEADQVAIGCFDPVMSADEQGENPGSDLAGWLSHHGCEVTVNQYPSGDREIGACILERAEETGADLIVMGAYGHARLRQAVFGGTTRTLLEQTEMRVLMAH